MDAATAGATRSPSFDNASHSSSAPCKSRIQITASTVPFARASLIVPHVSRNPALSSIFRVPSSNVIFLSVPSIILSSDETGYSSLLCVDNHFSAVVHSTSLGEQNTTHLDSIQSRIPVCLSERVCPCSHRRAKERVLDSLPGNKHGTPAS
jgi:hypothetical protein